METMKKAIWGETIILKSEKFDSFSHVSMQHGHCGRRALSYSMRSSLVTHTHTHTDCLPPLPRTVSVAVIISGPVDLHVSSHVCVWCVLKAASATVWAAVHAHFMPQSLILIPADWSAPSLRSLERGHEETRRERHLSLVNRGWEVEGWGV